MGRPLILSRSIRSRYVHVGVTTTLPVACRLCEQLSVQPVVYFLGYLTTLLTVLTRDLRIGNFRSNRITGVVVYMFNADLSCGSCVCALATAVQLHVKWSFKHKSQPQMAQRLMFLLNSKWAWFVVWLHTACAANLKCLNWHVTFELNSNRDVLFEFESNLEASQVPSISV